MEEKLYNTDSIYICDHKLAQPEVFIPVFPGTNCEYDSTKAFERAGAKVVTKVFKNLSAQDIRESVEEYKKRSQRHRSLCSQEVSLLVTNRTVPLNSLQRIPQCSDQRRSGKTVK